MLVTLLGNVILVKPLQPSKASPSMLFTLSGNVILVKPVQPRKASYQILATLFGMTLFLHPAINVLVAVSIIELQLSLES